MTAATGTGCKGCGNCCRVPGYVYLLPGETETIAEYLGLSVYDFTDQYTRLVNERSALSLKENTDGSCIFLDGDRCRVHDVKPSQCTAFPHDWRFDGWRDICPGNFDL